MLMLFGVPALGWYAVRPVITGYLKNRNIHFELARLKHDPVLFRKVISDQKHFEMPPPDLGIIFGNQDAKHTITKICNPYCKPCAKAHEELKEVLKNNNVKLQIIFAATNDPGDRRGLPVKHFLAIAAKGDEQLTEEALDHWYLGEEKEYEQFANKFRVNGELKQQDEKVERMDEWCRMTGIAYTPAIFVNGYLLPEPYHIPDLKYILRELE
jgi:protein-disulfide isomerase